MANADVFEEVLNTVQDVATDQTAVASKLQGLITDNLIRGDEIKSTTVIPFGANHFIVSIIYTIYGLKQIINRIGLSFVVSRILTAERRCVTKVGCSAKLQRIQLVQSRRVTTKDGLISISRIDFSKAPCIISAGLKTAVGRYLLNKGPLTKVGLALDWGYVFTHV